MRWNEFKKLLIHLLGACLLVAGVIFLVLRWLALYTRHGKEIPAPALERLTLDSAVTLLESLGMHWQVIDSVFSDSFKAHEVVKQSPSPGTPVKRGRKFYLIVNAVSPPLVSVPNLVDLPLEIARKRLEATGLKVGEVHFQPDIAHMVVLEQRVGSEAVAPGTLLPYGSMINLVVGISSDTTFVEVPSVVCLRFAVARGQLMENSLSLGAVILMVDSLNSVSVDLASMRGGGLDTFFVYSQYPPPSKTARVPPGTPVDLYLSPVKPSVCDSTSHYY